jgi:hypothetical protein
MTQNVQIAVQRAKFRSSQRLESRFIAGIVTENTNPDSKRFL